MVFQEVLFSHDAVDCFLRGERFAFGHHYFRPHETHHSPSRRFYQNELFRMPLYEIIPLEAVVATCCVLDLYTYCKGQDKKHKLSVWTIFSNTTTFKPAFFQQDGQRVWKNRMCTSVITAWTSQPTCSTRSTGTATPSAPSHMPSTTSQSGSRRNETSR